MTFDPTSGLTPSSNNTTSTQGKHSRSNTTESARTDSNSHFDATAISSRIRHATNCPTPNDGLDLLASVFAPLPNHISHHTFLDHPSPSTTNFSLLPTVFHLLPPESKHHHEDEDHTPNANHPANNVSYKEIIKPQISKCLITIVARLTRRSTGENVRFLLPPLLGGQRARGRL